MNYGGDRDKATICAVSTPSGFGGISVIRVSGQQTLSIVRRLFPNLPAAPESHKAFYGQILNPESKAPIDQAVLTFFSTNKSYTGEETIEISCHGNPIICDQIMQALVMSGASTAMPGEFTYRAFMNQRLDLVQAESVLSLIESRSVKSAHLSFQQLMGGLSKKMSAIEDQMTWCLAHIEASIDFSQEGLETTSQHVLTEKLQDAKAQIDEIVATYHQGRMIRNGIKIALLGQPNVGKSSLLNLLLGYDRSIVSKIAGTTRDVVSDEMTYQGQRLVFLDTAGIRAQTDDEIESMGIQRSFIESKDADQIFFIFDASEKLNEDVYKLIESLDPEKVTLVGNKKDLLSESELAETLKYIQGIESLKNFHLLFSSVVEGSCRHDLLDWTIKKNRLEKRSEDDILLANSRHYECLRQASHLIQQAVVALVDGVGTEFVSLELKEALMRIQDMLGKRYDDQIMDRVFKEFCVGK